MLHNKIRRKQALVFKKKLHCFLWLTTRFYRTKYVGEMGNERVNMHKLCVNNGTKKLLVWIVLYKCSLKLFEKVKLFPSKLSSLSPPLQDNTNWPWKSSLQAGRHTLLYASFRFFLHVPSSQNLELSTNASVSISLLSRILWAEREKASH